MIEKAKNRSHDVFWKQVSTDTEDPCRFQAEMPMDEQFSYVGTGNTPTQALECLLRGLAAWSILGKINPQNINFQLEPEKISR